MALKDITAGTKQPAKIRAGRFIEAKSGKIALEISFDFKEPSTDLPETLSYQYWLSEAALENSMKSLVETLGYNGSWDVDADGILTDPKVFDYSREVALVVELEEQKDAEGNIKYDKEGVIRTFPRIKYVNKIGGSLYAGLTVGKVKSSLAAIGFKGAFLSAKQSAGIPNAAEAVVKKDPQPTFDTEEEIPF